MPKEDIYMGELLVNGESYPLNSEAYEEWRDWRKAEKKVKIGERAEKLQHKLLTKYPPETQREIIEHSIMNSYQGLFPPKQVATGRTRDRSLEQDLNDHSWAT